MHTCSTCTCFFNVILQVVHVLPSCKLIFSEMTVIFIMLIKHVQYVFYFDMHSFEVALVFYSNCFFLALAPFFGGDLTI